MAYKHPRPRLCCVQARVPMFVAYHLGRMLTCANCATWGGYITKCHVSCFLLAMMIEHLRCNADPSHTRPTARDGEDSALHKPTMDQRWVDQRTAEQHAGATSVSQHRPRDEVQVETEDEQILCTALSSAASQNQLSIVSQSRIGLDKRCRQGYGSYMVM